MALEGELNTELWQKLFGNVAAEAEDEKFFQDHFVTNFKYSIFSNKAAFKIVVGNKGTGKSAFLRKFKNEMVLEKNIIIVVIDAPKLIGDMGSKAGVGPASIYRWREYFQLQAANAILASRIEDVTKLGALGLSGVTSGFISKIAAMAREKTQSISDEVLKLGKRIADDTRVFFIVDDLDKGWTGSATELAFVRDLITAMYDVSLKDAGISFRISLRWDIYDYLTRNIPDIDKIRSHVTYLSWTPHEVYIIGAKRISAALNREFAAEHVLHSDLKQDNISIFYDPILERKFYGTGGWSNTEMRRVIMSLVRRRPRDLFALLGKAGENTLSHGATKISSNNVDAVIKPYSDDRVNDLIAEYSSRFPRLEGVLDSFRPRKPFKPSIAFNYENSRMFSHLKLLISRHPDFRFSGEKVLPDPRRLIEFLYRIEFLQAYRKDEDKLARFDFEVQQKVFFGEEDVGFSWEVLPAYRWWLDPVDSARVTETLKFDPFD